MRRGTLTTPFTLRGMLVLTEDHGAVRHVVLNRPEKRNAFHDELVLATGAALRAAADDPAVHCVVLRGAGPMFSSGMDLGALGALAEAPEHLRAFRRHCLDAWNLAEEMPKPVICAIQGACIGGALELALACDFRVLAADAIVGMPETRIGLIPDVGGSSRLPQVVGLGRAKELVMTGKLIGAEEAERIGLATRVAPADDLDAAVAQLVDELLACAPVAVALAKRVMDASARPALSTTLELEVVSQERCAATADFAEGARAFAEKRAPEFSGG
jgi:enoyl-CoA hydratase/carnithine racemase